VTTRSRVGASLIAAFIAASALLVPASPADAAAVITVTSTPSWRFPQQLPAASSGLTTRITVTVSSTEPVASATATAQYDGAELLVTNPVQQLGTLAQPKTISFDVAGVAPGMHHLFVDVTSPSSLGGGTTLPYLWTSGSPLLTGTNPLFDRSYGWQGTEHVAGLESSTRAVQMLTIVSDTFAYVGLPPNGRPVCTTEGRGCVRYAYENLGQILQVGTGIIAKPYGPGLYTDGLVPADEQDGELFGRHVFSGYDSFTSSHSHLNGTFRYSSLDYPTGLTYEKVTFRKDGSYALAYAYDGGKVKKLAGRFRLGKHGEITFRSPRGRVVQRGTVLIEGRPAACVLKETCLGRGGGPYKRGIWLILSGAKGKHPDGNLLQRVH
jgi:hypothetical protein